MKTLKLDHEIAEQIRQKRRTSTWRMYDDKNVSVNDDIELIDKVDPTDPQSWVSLGTVRVDSIAEKRLSDITAADYQDDEQPFASSEEMLLYFQKHYGPQITLDSAVKIIGSQYLRSHLERVTTLYQMPRD